MKASRLCEMTITPGTKLGRYEIRSELGEGGVGDVRAVQLTIGVGKTVSVLNRNRLRLAHTRAK